MNNLIYRDQVIEAISKLPVKVDDLGYTWMIAGDVLKQIDNIPSVEPEERTAKVDAGHKSVITGVIMDGHCKNCGRYVMDEDDYCPGCGARLEWE